MLSRPIIAMLVGCALIAVAVVWAAISSTPPVPPLNSSAMATSSRAPDDQDLADPKALAAAGEPVHQNSLTIIALRCPRGVDGVDIEALLEAAASQGNAAARYNLALHLPNKFKTDPEINTKRIAFLDPNAKAGAPHSQVLLVKTLRFTNRDALMPDRETLRFSMLKQAAASGDRDSMLLFDDELYSRYRRTNRAGNRYQAADLNLAIYQAGGWARGGQTWVYAAPSKRAGT